MASFSVTQNNAGEQLLQSLLGNTAGLSNFEITPTGDSRAFGTFTNDPFKLKSGIVLSTGKVVDLAGANVADGGTSVSFGNPNDLSTDFGIPENEGDTITLQIDFDADDTKEKLYFQYVFGSEEFLEYAGDFNDSFSLSLNGINLAKLPSGRPVSVNELATQSGPLDSNFVYNFATNGAVRTETRLDGYTQPFTFEGDLIKKGRNSLVITVKDDRDGILDSAVFIKGGTLGTTRPPAIPGAIGTGSSGNRNKPPVAEDSNVQVSPNASVNLTSLAATDTDGSVVSYTITKLPDTTQGKLFLDNLATPKTAIRTGQVLTPAESRLLVFQANSGFTKTQFTFTATDDAGAIDLTPAIVTLTKEGTGTSTPNGSNGNNSDDGEDIDNCKIGKTIRGNNQVNTLIGGADADTLFGQNGDDILEGRDCSDVLYGGKGNDRLLGGNGNDLLEGEDGEDTLNGGKGIDKIHGESGEDFIKGGIKNDLLQGGINNDFLSGGVGRDQLLGGQGQDTLLGNYGSDTLTGGAGKDRFIYLLDTDGVDRINDFNINQDIIDLSQILSKPEYTSLDPLNDYLKFIQVGSHTKIEVDFNGDMLDGFKSLLILENITSNRLNISNFVL